MDFITGTVYCSLLLLTFCHLSEGYGQEPTSYYGESSSAMIDYPSFGCSSVDSIHPSQWSNEEVPGFEITEKKFDNNLRSLLYNIYHEFMFDTPYNNIDSIIEFHHAFNVSYRRQHDNFLDKYIDERRPIPNQNEALLLKIVRNKVVRAKYPLLFQSMFLAATVPRASLDLVQRLGDDGYDVFGTTIYKQVTAAIKIIITGENEGDLDRVGYMLFKPESNWGDPVTVMMGENKAYPHSGNFGKYEMLPDEYTCDHWIPDREYPLKLRNVQNMQIMSTSVAIGLEFMPYKVRADYDFFNNASTLITNKEFTGHVINGFQNPIIFVGKPFCAFEFDSFKYELVSAYRAIVNREANGFSSNAIILKLTEQKPSRVVCHFIEDVGWGSHMSFAIDRKDIEDYPWKVIEWGNKLGISGLLEKIKKLFQIMGNTEFMQIIYNNN